MSNYIEYKDTIAFHPGYYIKEIIDDSGLTQADFAKRLGTTPKNLSILIRGEQSLSIDIAMKLSRMLGTSVSYWLNLQNGFDSLLAEFRSDEELIRERQVFKYLDYKYFRNNYGLPDLPRKIDEQIIAVREFLKVASLSVFSDRDMSVVFRSSSDKLTDSNIFKANMMVQIAINESLNIETPKYDKTKFLRAVEYALTLTDKNKDKDFYPLLSKAFCEAGVVFLIMPNIEGADINVASKKIGNKIMLMINDRKLRSDSFWFTLFYEIGHIVNGDFGASFEMELGNKEGQADKYANDLLIPPIEYEEFKEKGEFTRKRIIKFAEMINRDPGIVVGRLQNDNLIDYNDSSLQSLKKKYEVTLSQS
ncbi:MAG: HigA family addiction module antidote protein [Lachnospiraceae bacterium]|nr:HigA family addiction module antidote protein [Lachnospiraceae bacterium]